LQREWPYNTYVPGFYPLLLPFFDVVYFIFHIVISCVGIVVQK
jgi:hypothetical protein